MARFLAPARVVKDCTGTTICERRQHVFRRHAGERRHAARRYPEPAGRDRQQLRSRVRSGIRRYVRRDVVRSGHDDQERIWCRVARREPRDCKDGRPSSPARWASTARWPARSMCCATGRSMRPVQSAALSPSTAESMCRRLRRVNLACSVWSATRRSAPNRSTASPLNAAGRNSALVANGSAGVQGTTIAVNAAPGDYARVTQYAVMRGEGGLSGIASATSSSPTLEPLVSKNDTTLFVTLLNREVPLQRFAVTNNGARRRRRARSTEGHRSGRSRRRHARADGARRPHAGPVARCDVRRDSFIGRSVGGHRRRVGHRRDSL